MSLTQKGVLVRCDPAVKQFILHLDIKHRFVIADLDETSVFIDASSGAETLINEGLEELNKKNTQFDADEERAKKKSKKK
jgi:TFIIH basal transcription factor complex TTD-A subunit